MWFKHRAWIPVAWLLSLVNLAAVWFAARPGEPWHATIHALLAGGLALGAQRLMARQRADAPSEELRQALDHGEYLQNTISGLQSRLQELEERVDAGEQLIARHRQVELPPGQRDAR